MKTENKNFFTNFVNALSKVLKLQTKNPSADSSYLSKEENPNTTKASYNNFAPSLCLGQTKGYADFLPSQSWQWFVSV